MVGFVTLTFNVDVQADGLQATRCRRVLDHFVEGHVYHSMRSRYSICWAVELRALSPRTTFQRRSTSAQAGSGFFHILVKSDTPIIRLWLRSGPFSCRNQRKLCTHQSICFFIFFLRPTMMVVASFLVLLPGMKAKADMLYTVLLRQCFPIWFDSVQGQWLFVNPQLFVKRIKTLYDYSNLFASISLRYFLRQWMSSPCDGFSPWFLLDCCFMTFHYFFFIIVSIWFRGSNLVHICFSFFRIFIFSVNSGMGPTAVCLTRTVVAMAAKKNESC